MQAWLDGSLEVIEASHAAGLTTSKEYNEALRHFTKMQNAKNAAVNGLSTTAPPG